MNNIPKICPACDCVVNEEGQRDDEGRTYHDECMEKLRYGHI